MIKIEYKSILIKNLHLTKQSITINKLFIS